MPKVLIIDDEPIFHKLTQRVLDPLGYEVVTALNGREGIRSAKENLPDVIVSDLVMPDMDGYEVVSYLRRDPNFAHTPILILTANTNLEDKLAAFEKGADDYLSKPFNPDEFRARVRVLVQRSEVAKTARSLVEESDSVECHTLAVHSLRGGLGCSSIALNLALALNGIWDRPVLLIDGVLIAGQLALMMNASSKRTWADLVTAQGQQYDSVVIQSIISKHESGLHYVAAPAYPVDADGVSPKMVEALTHWTQSHYDYIVIDVAHNFNNTSLHLLDRADVILLIAAPEMASIRAAAAALHTYNQLDYPPEKVHLILNCTYQRRGLEHRQIEEALNKKISLVIPYSPDLFANAINLGRPIIPHHHEHPVGEILENMAYKLSQPKHRDYPPIKPSETWTRVTHRLKKTA
jgi:pilus assembly protein CpaE